MRKKASLVLVAIGVAAAAALFGGVLGGPGAKGTVTHADPAAAERLVSGFAPPGDTAAYVAELEQRVAANGRDSQASLTSSARERPGIPAITLARRRRCAARSRSRRGAT